jgi:hypothetical protein
VSGRDVWLRLSVIVVWVVLVAFLLLVLRFVATWGGGS